MARLSLSPSALQFTKCLWHIAPPIVSSLCLPLSVHFWKIEVSNIVISGGHVRSPLPCLREGKQGPPLGSREEKSIMVFGGRGGGHDGQCLLMPKE